MPLRADWGMQGSCPALLCAVCRPQSGAIAFPGSVYSRLQQRRVRAGVQEYPTGGSRSPRGQRHRGKSERRQTTGGNRPTGQRRTQTPAGICGGGAAIPDWVSALPEALTAVPAVCNWLYHVRRGMQIELHLGLRQRQPCTCLHCAVGLLPCRIFPNLPQKHGILYLCPCTSCEPYRPARWGNRLRIFPAIAVQNTSPKLFLRIHHQKNFCRLLIPMSFLVTSCAPVACAKGVPVKGFSGFFLPQGARNMIGAAAAAAGFCVHPHAPVEFPEKFCARVWVSCNALDEWIFCFCNVLCKKIQKICCFPADRACCSTKICIIALSILQNICYLGGFHAKIHSLFANMRRRRVVPCCNARQCPAMPPTMPPTMPGNAPTMPGNAPHNARQCLRDTRYRPLYIFIACIKTMIGWAYRPAQA